MKLKTFALLTSICLLVSASFSQVHTTTTTHTEPYHVTYPNYNPTSGSTLPLTGIPNITSAPNYPTSLGPQPTGGDTSENVSPSSEPPAERKLPANLRVSNWSPAWHSPDLIRSAAEIGDRSLRSDHTRVFSALPQLSNWMSSRMELWRMDLDSSQMDDWRSLNSTMQSRLESSPIKIETAAKQELLDELSKGYSDVVVLIAHFDGQNIFLSGAFGDKISTDDISNLKRDTAPDRAVVLLVCNAGTVNQNVASLADIILGNKLAKTVFASPDQVDARKVPDILDSLLLQSVPMSKALEQGFNQIVNLLRRWHTEG